LTVDQKSQSRILNGLSFTGNNKSVNQGGKSGTEDDQSEYLKIPEKKKPKPPAPPPNR